MNVMFKKTSCMCLYVTLNISDKTDLSQYTIIQKHPPPPLDVKIINLA